MGNGETLRLGNGSGGTVMGTPHKNTIPHSPFLFLVIPNLRGCPPKNGIAVLNAEQ